MRNTQYGMYSIQHTRYKVVGIAQIIRGCILNNETTSEDAGALLLVYFLFLFAAIRESFVLVIRGIMLQLQ